MSPPYHSASSSLTHLLILTHTYNAQTWITGIWTFLKWTVLNHQKQTTFILTKVMYINFDNFKEMQIVQYRIRSWVEVNSPYTILKHCYQCFVETSDFTFMFLAEPFLPKSACKFVSIYYLSSYELKNSQLLKDKTLQNKKYFQVGSN